MAGKIVGVGFKVLLYDDMLSVTWQSWRSHCLIRHSQNPLLHPATHKHHDSIFYETGEYWSKLYIAEIGNLAFLAKIVNKNI